MITRRRFLLGTSLVPLATASFPILGLAGTAPPLPKSGSLSFVISRNGSEIGRHILAFTEVADGFDVKITVKMVVHFGPIPIFRYTLDGMEQWRAGQVSNVSMRANNDGTSDHMHAERDSSGLWVSGSGASRYLAPPEALPATHWNKAELDGPWINPENGKLLHPMVTNAGSGTVTLANGEKRPAEHYKLTGDATLGLWYDEANQWTALDFAAKDGSSIRYALT